MSATHADLEDVALECGTVILRPIDALDLVREHTEALTALVAAEARVDQFEATLRDLVAAASVVVDGGASWSQWAGLEEVLARARGVQARA